MGNRFITPSRSLAYSPFYLDFLADHKSARDFFVSPSIEDSARWVASSSYNRPALVEILNQQNMPYGSSTETLASIERLADASSVCLFTGQQAGLLGGPLLTLVKALGVIKRARTYQERLGRSVIPVFWIAGDDHDFLEANHTWLINRDSEPLRISYDAVQDRALPMGETPLNDADALTRMHASLHECLGDTDFTASMYALIDQCYRANETLVTAFGKLMSRLTAGTGLVLFSPYDAQVKQLAAPFFQRVLDRREAIHETLAEANKQLESRHYHLQVEKSEQSCFLFINDNGRKPILCDGSQFTAGERVYTKQELHSLIAEEPQRFSPDALTRPLLQSYLFPVVGQLGGPAEIAYLAQMNHFFEVLQIPAPHHSHRPSLTVVEKRHVKFMSEAGIEFEQLTGDVEQVVNRVLSATFPHDIEANVTSLRDDFKSRFESFTVTTLTFDPTLDEFARQSLGKIDFSLKALEAKLFSSHKKRSKETRERIYRLWHTLYPNHGLQERSLNVTYFLARYGTGFVSYLLDQIDAEQSAHQLISLSEYDQ